MGRQESKRIALTAGAFAIPLILYWLGGGDFSRDVNLAASAGLSVGAAALVWAFIGERVA